MFKHKKFSTIVLIIFSAAHLTISGFNTEDDKKIIGNQTDTNDTEVAINDEGSISYVSVEEKGRLIWFTPIDITEVNASSKTKKIFDSEEEFYSWRKSKEYKVWKENNSQCLILVKKNPENEEEKPEKVLTDKGETEIKEDTNVAYDTSYEVSEYTPTFKNMEELKSHINSEEYKISKIGKEVKALKEEIFTLKSEITSLKTSLGKL